jgi:hypothetical protein
MRWRTRSLLAALTLGGLAAMSFGMGLESSFAAGALAIAAVLFTRRSLMAQALARATTWAALLPNVLVTIILVAGTAHAPPLRIVAQMALAAFALVVSRPLLTTEHARASFAPLALRSWFLAASVGAMASGLALASLAAAFAPFGLVRDVVGMSVLAAPLFASGIGVLRMRAWGIALGVLAAIVALPVVAWMRDPLLAWPILAATAPGALMGALVLAARAGVGHAPVEQRVRVEPRLRVDAGEEDIASEELVAECGKARMA